jgi:hypothetical protein
LACDVRASAEAMLKYEEHSSTRPSRPQELLELKREIKDGMYSPLAYIISNAILQVQSCCEHTLAP